MPRLQFDTKLVEAASRFGPISSKMSVSCSLGRENTQEETCSTRKKHNERIDLLDIVIVGISVVQRSKEGGIQGDQFGELAAFIQTQLCRWIDKTDAEV